MRYQKINNIAGWVVFGVATLVYFLTVEPTASFWDCGEFIAVSYKLEVPHPPGAPFFLLVGRIFSMFAGGDVEKVAYWINISSVLFSGFTILFLFWSITTLAHKIMGIKNGSGSNQENMRIILGGIIGSFAYTFSDSFWFSAVEAEVYAMSSFFTAFVVWAFLKWELIEDEQKANRWLIMIAYTIGLSIGVHLLNLVTIPALALLIYFKKRQKKTTLKGMLATFAIGGVILVVIMEGIIPGLPSIAGKIEVFFVNSLGFPFYSGAIFFVILFLGAILFGILYSIKSNNPIANTIMLSFTFIIIGYSCYTLVLIRSNYNTPIDENNPENLISFVSYLKREQYGSRPLFYGNYYDAELIDQKRGAAVYAKVTKKSPEEKDRYEIVDYKLEQKYDPKRSTILPRMYVSGSDAEYRQIVGLKEGESPSFSHNIIYLFKHQIGHMYMRYFMWNFAGRESDIQNAGWVTPLDALKKLPEELKKNKARNNYLMIPFLLGIIGLFYHQKKDKRTFSVVMMLFLMTGLILIGYLNPPPVEPRERDYIYVGSFYFFALWIGFSVLAISEFLSKFFKNKYTPIVVSLFLTAPCPILMAKENWDDHNRSHRYFSVDSAKNFLASCAPNAILFTGGDNDTFPLWYVQEVEGFRTDVRVVVLSYFNTDWYIEQMYRDAYLSKPFPFSLDPLNYRQGGPNDFVVVQEMESLKNNSISLTQYLKLVKENHPAILVTNSISSYNSIPTKQVFVDVDTADVRKKNIVPAYLQEMVADKFSINISGRILEKKDLAILDIINTNKWERPIYFNLTSLSGIGLNLKGSVIQEGTVYRLLPLNVPSEKTTLVNPEVMYDNLINKCYWRGLQDPNVYLTEDYRNFVLNSRSVFNVLAEVLVQDNQKEKAKTVLLKSLEFMPDTSIMYDHFTLRLVSLLLEVDEREKAIKIAETMSKRADEMLIYFKDNTTMDPNEVQKNIIILNELSQMFKQIQENQLATKYEELFRKHYEVFQKRMEL